MSCRSGVAELDSVGGGPVADVFVLVSRQAAQDDIDRVVVVAAGADRLQRGQRVRSGLLLADCAPDRVVTQQVAALELPHPVKLVVVGPLLVGAALERPPRPDGATYLAGC